MGLLVRNVCPSLMDVPQWHACVPPVFLFPSAIDSDEISIGTSIACTAPRARGRATRRGGHATRRQSRGVVLGLLPRLRGCPLLTERQPWASHPRQKSETRAPPPQPNALLPPPSGLAPFTVGGSHTAWQFNPAHWRRVHGNVGRGRGGRGGGSPSPYPPTPAPSSAPLNGRRQQPAGLPVHWVGCFPSTGWGV